VKIVTTAVEESDDDDNNAPEAPAPGKDQKKDPSKPQEK
jgi:hypothetical protein